MLSEKGVENLFKQISKLYIEPEIELRKQASILPSNFKISQCLIKLPKGEKPIIEFNNEIQWIVHVEFAPNMTISKGQDIYLHEIKKIWAVSLPEIDSERVAFIYLFFNGIGYQIAFDFTPNVPDEVLSKEEKLKSTLSLSEQIGKSLQAAIEEKTISIHDKERLQEIGLWIAPGLLSYPLSKIIKQLGENDIQGARNTLVEYCTPQYLKRISSKWWAVDEFNSRKKLLMDALNAHKSGQYGLSIHALLPQIEGIITERVYEEIPEGKPKPFREESKIKKFQSLEISKGPLSIFAHKRITDSAIEFMLGGSLLGDFSWGEETNKTFPNRHVVVHGNYEEELFSEENSIKLFLLLDTIYHIISTRSAI